MPKADLTQAVGLRSQGTITDLLNKGKGSAELKIKAIASEKNISIYRIERDLSLSNGVISKWNKSIPSVTTLKSVADYLRVPLEKLLED
ncbi:TPA: helix-turn-helix transcriptional regulator [Streptococcus pyogenes]|nr:helix-turn-helix transcriptional regulator [Streptococcus pyogenes]